MQAYDIPIHDIKDIEFTQTTDWISAGEVVVAVVVLIFVLIYIIRKTKKHNAVDYYQDLTDAAGLKDVRQRAYEITRIGAYLADKNELTKMRYVELCESLQEYKYKKIVSEFSDETKKIFLSFLDAINTCRK